MTAEAKPWLLLRLEAPLMAFGGPMVDYIGRTRNFPGQAQIAGMLANALGYNHQDSDALEQLQARLRFASVLLRPGEAIRDYHTVDLGQRHLSGTGWTTRGAVEERGGASSDGTHIRHRWYLADALVLVALALMDGDPGVADLEVALEYPARPLFIGRKTCLPTAPILLGPPVTAATAREALSQGVLRLPRPDPDVRAKDGAMIEIDARLSDPDMPNRAEEQRLVDIRDWRNQMHTGGRDVRRYPFPVANGVGSP